MSQSEIGTRSHDGLLEISDTNWDSNGTLTVTIREMIGQQWSDYNYPVLRRARTLAKSALGNYRSTKLIRSWFANGQSHVTFKISRLDSLR